MSIETIMTKDQYGNELVLFARQTAQTLVRNKLTRSQIRNIFTEVRKIESSWNTHKEDAMRRLNMLKPKMAYQSERTPSVKELEKVLSQAIDQVSEAKESPERDRRFRVFMDLFEAILAYHRAEGGRN